ncbi:MAG: hypothetical protein Q8O40_10995 [Chloroflexota bacterium]|nr:hypothetical protein [Chloroflexota bacterium]
MKQIQSQYASFKESWKSRGLAFDDLVTVLKAQLLDETFRVAVDPSIKVDTGNSELDDFVNSVGRAVVARQWQELLQFLKDCGDHGGFWKSTQLLESPFLHIRASLMAADIAFFPGGQPRSSLNTDFDIIATVYPYVDMLATDGYMVDLIRRSHLSERYAVDTFSMSHKDELVQAVWAC